MNLEKVRRRMARAPLAAPRPLPAWMIADYSEYARTAVSRFAAERHRAELHATIISQHPAPYVGDVVTAAARTMQRLAVGVGFETKLLEGLDSCTLEGWSAARRIGFRATWLRGKAHAATWHESTRYAVVSDERPVKVAQVSRTALAGKRAAGIGQRRLSMVASARGMGLGVTALTARLKALS